VFHAGGVKSCGGDHEDRGDEMTISTIKILQRAEDLRKWVADRVL
jgi:hypothetical protein